MSFKIIILLISKYNILYVKEMEEIIISVFERFYDKDVIVQKTFEIETKLYDKIEFLCI